MRVIYIEETVRLLSEQGAQVKIKSGSSQANRRRD
jgi:hypothetical protein